MVTLDWIEPTYATTDPPLQQGESKVKIQGEIPKGQSDPDFTLIFRPKGTQLAHWKGAVPKADIRNVSYSTPYGTVVKQQAIVLVKYYPTGCPPFPSSGGGGGGGGGMPGPSPTNPVETLGIDVTEAILTDTPASPTSSGNTTNPTEGTGVGEP